MAAHEVNEVFFDDVEVPVENRVHDEGKGLDGRQVSARPRADEHRAHRRVAARARTAEGARRERAARTASRSSTIRASATSLSRLEIELMALTITNLRFLDELRGGRAPGAEVSMLKIKGTEIQQIAHRADDAGRGPARAAVRADRRFR